MNITFKNLRSVLIPVVLFSYILFSLNSFHPSKNFLSSTYPDFSEVKMLKHVYEISKEPHYIGSQKHASVRNYIISELESYGLEVHTQTGISVSNSAVASIPQNIIAKIPGRKSGNKSLLLLSHYDSAVHSSFGAADAASGVATILESIRAFMASKKQHDNDIIICITDGEEIGLNGAYLFVREHPLAKDVGLVLNFEARGASGPSNMLLEVPNGNTNLIKSFKEAKVHYPIANSLMYSIYKLLPNDTDSTVFREELAIPSFFFAFIDDHYVYHTALDVPETLNPKSLVHQATYLSQLLPLYANFDLSSLHTLEDSIYFDFPMLGIVGYPFGWSLSLWVIILFFYIYVVYLASSKKINFSLKKVTQSITKNTIFLVSFVCTSYFLWDLICYIYPQYRFILQGFTYNGHYYIFSFASFVTLCTFLWISFIGRKITILENALAGQFFWLIITLMLVIYLDGASYLVIPLFFSICISLLEILNFRGKTTFQLLLAFPIIIIITPFVQFVPVGLGLQFLFVSFALIVLLCFLLVPLIIKMKHKKVTYSMLGLFSLIGIVAAHLASDFSEERPRPSSLVYLAEKDQNMAYFATYESQLSPWNASFLYDYEELNDFSMVNFPSKYHTSFKRFFKAPSYSIEASTYKVQAINETTTLITFFPCKQAHRIELFLTKPTTFSRMLVNGKLFKGNLQRNQHLLTYYVVNQEPLELTLETPQGIKLQNLLMFETSYQLMNNELFAIPARPQNEMPMPFVINDAVIQTQKIEL